MPIEADTSLVVVGSIGRGEVTSGSDVDFMVVVNDDGAAELAEKEIAAEVARQGERADVRQYVSDKLIELRLAPPSSEGPLGEVVLVSELCKNISKDPYTNQTLTRRMLLLLESASFGNEEAWTQSVEKVRDTYLGFGHKDGRPPRFFLNDVFRYWRTLCVDYEGKMRDRGMAGWALRNAKLRTVRKMLFASGLLPLLECHRFSADEISGFLATRLAMPAADRVAAAFLENGAAPQGGSALAAYSTFLERLGDPDWRNELSSLPEQERATSSRWQEAKALGRTFEAGLMYLLYDTALAPTTRAYSIF